MKEGTEIICIERYIRQPDNRILFEINEIYMVKDTEPDETIWIQSPYGEVGLTLETIKKHFIK